MDRDARVLHWMLEVLTDSLLDDDSGISEKSYIALCDYLEKADAGDILAKVQSYADACDGRFYYPEKS